MICHGDDLQGGIGVNLTDPTWQHGDTKAAIANTIRNGIEATEMIAYGAVFPDDIDSLADFVLSKQMGMRELKGEFFELSPEETLQVWSNPGVLDDRKPKKSFAVPENIIHFTPDVKDLGLLARYRAKLYVREPGRYRLSAKTLGMARILIDGQERFSGGNLERKHAAVEKSAEFELTKGVFDLELLYAKKAATAPEFSPTLINLDNSRQYKFFGSPLGGLSPMVVSPGEKAKLFRGRTHRGGASGTSLWIGLPNESSLIFDPTTARIVAAWSGGFLDYTSVKTGRGGAAVIDGTEFPPVLETIRVNGDSLTECDYKSSLIQGRELLVSIEINGVLFQLSFAPEGERAFSIRAQAQEEVDFVELDLKGEALVNGQPQSGRVRLTGADAQDFKIEISSNQK